MSTFFPITKIRLVNFHNVGTTILDLPNGGHLFMLGDNGSGKTTVLDAVHFVLDPGRSMEFNSAARVVGAKNAGGRTIQGIIMRFNIETNGPMNPNGGITYAALEIKGRNGKPVSIAVGVSTRSMEERYESWGIISDGPVASLPLCIHEGNRTRPATRSEVKAAMKGKGYYHSISRYTDELATRFFGNRETYLDVCRLLSTGKAYREIAARAGDYDKLFRELLQEPQKEIFEDLIRGLKTLEESRQALDALQARVEFVQKLVDLKAEIHQAKLSSICCKWQSETLQVDAANQALQMFKDHKIAEIARREELASDHEKIALDLERCIDRIAELRKRDSNGLVNQERFFKTEWERTKHKFTEACSRLLVVQRKLKDEESELNHASDALTKQVGHFTSDLYRIGSHLPFSTQPLMTAYDEACRDEFPENAMMKIEESAQLSEEADQALSKITPRIHSIQERIGTCEAEQQKIEHTIDQMRNQDEAYPMITGFAEAKIALRDQLLDAMPLYEGLVPVSTLRPSEIAMLEQLIGDSILGTWLVSAENADEARKLLFKSYPEQSLAVTGEEDDTPCDWLGSFFDLTRSNPEAIYVLRRQLTAQQGPTARTFLENRILHFRGREMPVLGDRPRLIGQEARRDQLQRNLKEKEKRLHALSREIRLLNQELNQLQEQHTQLNNLKSMLRQSQSILPTLCMDLKDRRKFFQIAQSNLVSAAEERMRCEEDEQYAHEKHEDVLLLMRQTGIDEDLESKTLALEKKRRNLEKHLTECDREDGAAARNISQLETKISETADLLAQTIAKRTEQEKLILKLQVPTIPLNEFIPSQCGCDVTSQSALTIRADECSKRTVLLAERLRHLLIDTTGLTLGFIYEEATNELHDRRGETVQSVLKECSNQLAEQRSVINEETVRIFQEIVMDKLMRALGESVARLQEMSRKVGRLLKNRMFGQNRYVFTISPIAEYVPLIEIVRNYHALDIDETTTALKEFLDAHRDDILATDVGDIPALLDYRNWFRYELKIMTSDSEGRTIDRKVKGLGSGGEQAVPNYLLILTIANFLYDRERIHLPVLIFDEAFYGIDAMRRNQLLAFASDLGLQLFVASPDQDGVKKEIPRSTSVLVVKDSHYDVHLYPCHWNNTLEQGDLLDFADPKPQKKNLVFEEETH